MRPLPRILKQRTVAESRYFSIEARDLAFANGARREYECLRSRSEGAVLVVPMLDAHTVVLIREYAGGTHRYELQLPKGLIEANEDPLAAAQREMQEEIGYGAEQLQILTRLATAPGYLAHHTTVVLAQGLYPSRLPGDEPEEIEVIPHPLADIDGLVARDDFNEARSIAALYLAQSRLGAAHV